MCAPVFIPAEDISQIFLILTLKQSRTAAFLVTCLEFSLLVFPVFISVSIPFLLTSSLSKWIYLPVFTTYSYINFFLNSGLYLTLVGYVTYKY